MSEVPDRRSLRSRWIDCAALRESTLALPIVAMLEASARRQRRAGEFSPFPTARSSCTSRIAPAGDQPEAIAKLVEGIDDGLAFQTLLGVTGSGKTFTMANVIARLGRPALVLAPNKTLAAQLYSEFREFFPKNAVEYFVSLLRLLPARGLRAAARPVHREGLARSTSTSSRCGCRRPSRCSSGATW